MVEPDALFQIDLIAEQFGLRLVDAHHIGSLTDTIRNHSIFFSKRRFGQQALKMRPPECRRAFLAGQNRLARYAPAKIPDRNNMIRTCLAVLAFVSLAGS